MRGRPLDVELGEVDPRKARPHIASAACMCNDGIRTAPDLSPRNAVACALQDYMCLLSIGQQMTQYQPAHRHVQKSQRSETIDQSLSE